MSNVYRRGKSWVTNVLVHGKRKRHAYRTKPEAQRAAVDFIHLRNSAKRGDLPKDISWSFFKAKHAELTQTKNEQTRYRDRHAFAMLEECYPIKRLNQVTPELLEALKGRLLTRLYRKPAINRCLTAIKAALRCAEAWKYIQAQNWRTVSALKTPQARLLFYSLEELARLKAKCRGVWLSGFMLGYEAGLRPMEKLALEVKDVHWNLHKLNIHESKGGKSRWVPMTERLEAYLRSIPMGPTFVLGDDKPNKDVWSSYWRKLVKSAKLKGSEYTLRHSFASHYIMAGGKIEKLQIIMGHSSIKTTQIYTHLSPESLESGMKSLPEPVSTLCTPLRIA